MDVAVSCRMTAGDGGVPRASQSRSTVIDVSASTESLTNVWDQHVFLRKSQDEESTGDRDEPPTGGISKKFADATNAPRREHGGDLDKAAATALSLLT